MKKLIAGIFISFSVLACTKSGLNSFTPDCSTTKSWTTDVSPVIQANCATNSGCHSTGSHQGPGALTTYDQVYNSRGPIRSAVAGGSMPQGSTLTAAQKNAIICWIDNGAANN